MIKAGVQLLNLQPQMAIAYAICCEVYRQFDEECVITSGCEGTHSDMSRHYLGLALDLRTRELDKPEQRQVRNECARRLGDEFDVILEKTHLHVEYDPKRTKPNL